MQGTVVPDITPGPDTFKRGRTSPDRPNHQIAFDFSIDINPRAR